MKFQIGSVWDYCVSYTNIWMENHRIRYSTYEIKTSKVNYEICPINITNISLSG